MGVEIYEMKNKHNRERPRKSKVDFENNYDILTSLRKRETKLISFT